MQGDQLQQLLKFLTDTLAQGKEFTLTEAPLFVRELLMWRYYESLFFVGLGIALILVGWIVGFIARRAIEDETALYVCGVIGSAVGLALAAVNAHAAIMVQVAPRVVLVQMVRDLLSTR